MKSETKEKYLRQTTIAVVAAVSMIIGNLIGKATCGDSDEYKDAEQAHYVRMMDIEYLEALIEISDEYKTKEMIKRNDSLITALTYEIHAQN